VVIAFRPGGGWNAQLESLPWLMPESGVGGSEMKGIDFFDLFFLCFVVEVDIGFRIYNEITLCRTRSPDHNNNKSISCSKPPFDHLKNKLKLKLSIEKTEITKVKNVLLHP